MISRPSAALITALLALRLGAADPRGDAYGARLRSPAEEQAALKVPAGFTVQLVASEPDLPKPLNLAFDAAGRVWVTGSRLYPWPARRDAVGQPIAGFDQQWDDNPVAFRANAGPPPPPEHGEDQVCILSDFGPDGRARRVSVFADGLNIPLGVTPLPRRPGDRGDRALVFSIPAIWLLTDTDGDGRADLREKLYDGFGFKDTHGMSSNYWAGPDGWIYATHGFANVSRVQDRSGRIVALTSGNTCRFLPDGSRFELYVHGQTNPFGLAFDPRGELFTADSHSKPVYQLVPGGYYEGIGREHDGLGFGPSITLDDHGSSAIAGLAHLAGPSFSPEYQDNLLNGNPVTRRLNRDRLEWTGSTARAVRQEDFLTSEDPSFRPVQVKLGPDGALWIADFYNPIIGHYEVPLTHPGRDRTHGRIWRVAPAGTEGNRPDDLTRLSTLELVPRLRDGNAVARGLALELLLARPDARTAAPALAAAATDALRAPVPDGDWALLPLFFALERLGQLESRLLEQAWSQTDGPGPVVALRIWTARGSVPADGATRFRRLLAQPGGPGLPGRLVAQLLAAHPQPWAAPLLLEMAAATPAGDTLLAYALRLALKAQVAGADLATLRRWSLPAGAAAHLAEAGLAVPSAAVAEFLLEHLATTRFQTPRAGDLARHAVQHLPPTRLDVVETLIRELASAPASDRLGLAEGLATAARGPSSSLPSTVEAWMEGQLLEALAGPAPLATRAVPALKSLGRATHAAPLRRVALDATQREPLRSAALRALPAGSPVTTTTVREVLASTAPNGLRRTAAELLGPFSAEADVRATLAKAFRDAPADLAVILAASLARSDAGARELHDLAASGRAPRAVLRHRTVAAALAGRPAALRGEFETLLRDVPPEDARLDAVIAQRLATAATLTPDASHGPALFARHCAACHRFRGEGANLGPNLDGLGARTLVRTVEDILDPSRNVDPQFRLAKVTLADGTSREGMNLRDEGEDTLLTEPATGQLIRVARRDLRSREVSPTSAMPPTFETQLSAAELFDLLAYLRGTAR